MGGDAGGEDLNPISTVITKKCYVCGREKSISEFYRDSYAKDGYRGKCKKCFREYVTLKKCNAKPRRTNRRTSQLAAALHVAQQRGVVAVTACMKLVRSGKWDEFLEVR